MLNKRLNYQTNLKLCCDTVSSMRFQHAVAFSNQLHSIEPTNIISMKIQLHSVNALWKCVSQCILASNGNLENLKLIWRSDFRLSDCHSCLKKCYSLQKRSRDIFLFSILIPDTLYMLLHRFLHTVKEIHSSNKLN